MAPPLVSYDVFNNSSLLTPPNGPWASDSTFDSSRDSLFNSAATNRFQFTGGIAARVGAGSLGVAGQTMGFSYTWIGCLTSLSYTDLSRSNRTLLTSVGGNVFSTSLQFCGYPGSSNVIQQNGTIVLDSDASTTILMYNQNVPTVDNVVVWTSMTNISLQFTPGALPLSTRVLTSTTSGGTLPVVFAQPSSEGHSSQSPSPSSPLALPSLPSMTSSSASNATTTTFESGGATFVSSPSGVTIVAGVGAVQSTSPSPTKPIASTIVGASLGALVGVLVIVACFMAALFRRKRHVFVHGEDYEKATVGSPVMEGVKDELRPRPFGGGVPLTASVHPLSPQSLEKPPLDVAEGLIGQRLPVVVEDAVRTSEEMEPVIVVVNNKGAAADRVRKVV